MQHYLLKLFSPDMICKDHDLCIYTANFHESGHGPSEKRDSLIWEGHGLMAWIMDQSRNEIYVYGKSNHHETIDIYIELQPVSGQFHRLNANNQLIIDNEVGER